jgi:hypothetical protein
MNLSTKSIAGVVATNTSYFIMRGASSGNWYLYYVTNISRPDTVQNSTAPGSSWENFTGTVSAFVSQYTPINYTNYYYICANDTVGNGNCTDVINNTILESIQGPTIPGVFNPISIVYNKNISINYTSSESTSNLSYYNITLTNADHSWNKTIVANNSLNLSYLWDSIGTPDGNYTIRVEATDTAGLFGEGYSEEFQIDNAPPYFTIIPPNTTITYPQGFGVYFNATNTVTFGSYAINWSTLFIINRSGYLQNSTPHIPVGNYLINVSINDTVGNLNSTIYGVVINSNPYIPLNITNCTDLQAMQNDLSVNYLANTSIGVLF